MADNKSIGALWENDKGRGVYMTGSITVLDETVKIVVFKNDRKQEGEKYPDWRIFISKPKEQQSPKEQTDLEPF